MSSPSTTTRFRAFAAAGACVAALGFAACGGDDETTTTATTEETGATGETGDASGLDPKAQAVLREQFNEQLITVLTTEQDLTQAQAECAVEELESSISDDELGAAIVEASESGEAPQDLIDAGFDAGQACADAE